MDIFIPDFSGIEVIEPRILFVDDTDNRIYKDNNIVETRAHLSNYDNDYCNYIIECLNMILSVNTGVVIYRVEVCNRPNNEKEIVIYSDKRLNTKYLENKTKNGTSNLAKFELINPSDNVLDTIDKNLNEPQYCPEGAISVNELYQILNMYILMLDENISNIKNRLIDKISNFKNKSYEIDELKFDFFTKKLQIRLSYNAGNVYLRPMSEILFFQLYNDNVIVPVDRQDSEIIELYKLIEPELNSCFNYFLKNELLFSKSNKINSIPTINSDYVIKIDSKNAISHFVNGEDMLTIKHNNKEVSEYEYEYQNVDLFEMILLKGNLNDLYNNTFVMIDDCPIFLQDAINNHIDGKKEQNSLNSEELLNINHENKGSKFRQKVKLLFNKKHN